VFQTANHHYHKCFCVKKNWHNYFYCNKEATFLQHLRFEIKKINFCQCTFTNLQKKSIQCGSKTSIIVSGSQDFTLAKQAHSISMIGTEKAITSLNF
jgi:hypothetical protein